MNTFKTSVWLAAFTSAAALCPFGTAIAQVAGTSTEVGVSVVESTQITNGWSVKKTILGKTIYNEDDQKVGKVDDLIISTDRYVSYVIVGAGGFVGMGRHDVAIPVSQIKNEAGKLVMPGASKDIIKALPEFRYMKGETVTHEQFVANAEKDIAKAETEIATLQKKAAEETSDAKASLKLQADAAQRDFTLAEAKVTRLKAADAQHWKSFMADVNAAMKRLRRSIDKATS